MVDFLKQVGIMYAGLAASWLVVSAIVWVAIKLGSARLDKRRIEGETAPKGEAARGILHTFTRGTVAMAIVNAGIVALFPEKALPPLTPVRFLFEVVSVMIAFDFLFYVA